MTELKAKHPEVTKMCKKEWRKHYRSLETEEAKKEARVERAKQTAEKERIISEYQLQQKQDKRKQASSNIAVKYADGEQANKGWMRSNKNAFLLAPLFAYSALMACGSMQEADPHKGNSHFSTPVLYTCCKCMAKGLAAS